MLCGCNNDIGTWSHWMPAPYMYHDTVYMYMYVANVVHLASVSISLTCTATYSDFHYALAPSASAPPTFANPIASLRT